MHAKSFLNERALEKTGEKGRAKWKWQVEKGPRHPLNLCTITHTSSILNSIRTMEWKRTRALKRFPEISKAFWFTDVFRSGQRCMACCLISRKMFYFQPGSTHIYSIVHRNFCNVFRFNKYFQLKYLPFLLRRRRRGKFWWEIWSGRRRLKVKRNDVEVDWY